MIMSKSLIFFVVTQLPGDECSLLPYSHYWISSKRILTSQGFISGSGFSFSYSWSIFIWLGFLPYFLLTNVLHDSGDKRREDSVYCWRIWQAGEFCASSDWLWRCCCHAWLDWCVRCPNPLLVVYFLSLFCGFTLRRIVNCPKQLTMYYLVN